MACWENAVITNFVQRRGITISCLSMHLASSICEKQQEHVICIWEGKRIWRVKPPQWMCWHWFVAVPLGSTLSQAFTTLQHTTLTAAHASTRWGWQNTRVLSIARTNERVFILTGPNWNKLNQIWRKTDKKAFLKPQMWLRVTTSQLSPKLGFV